MGQQRQKPYKLLGLGMLTVEMRSEEREAQLWIFFGVDGDEDYVWVWFSTLREEKILRRKRGARNIMHVLYPD